MLIRIVPLLIVALFLASSAPAQEKGKDNPILAEVKANLKDSSKPFVMFVRIKIKDGNASKFETAFEKARVATRKEKGNKAYNLNRSTKTPSEYIVYERWQDFKALETHMKTPHYAALLTEIGDMLDGAPDVKVFIPTKE